MLSNFSMVLDGIYRMQHSSHLNGLRLSNGCDSARANSFCSIKQLYGLYGEKTNSPLTLVHVDHDPQNLQRLSPTFLFHHTAGNSSCLFGLALRFFEPRWTHTTSSIFPRRPFKSLLLLRMQVPRFCRSVPLEVSWQGEHFDMPLSMRDRRWW